MSQQFSLKELEAILVKQGYLTDEEFAEAVRGANDENAFAIICENEIVNKDIIGEAFAESQKIKFDNIADVKVDDDLRSIVSKNVISEQRLLPIKIAKGEVLFATDSKNIKQKQKSLKSVKLKNLPQKTKKRLVYTLPQYFESIALSFRDPINKRLNKLLNSQEQVATKVVDGLINEALTLNVSDIHFEPRSQDVLLRFRIDGVLQDIVKLELEVYRKVLNRVKVLGGLRIDEHNKMQDGALKINWHGQQVDIRIAIAPTLHGEKIVLRLLSSYLSSLNLANLGVTKEKLGVLMEQSRKPFGMIIVVGPTGAGKTTTLYSLIKQINVPEMNITTIEDPVEYRMNRVNQIQVKPEAGITFATGLRSIVRQDPDVILVGEIRDRETAEIGVNAALTGHLLFSTFHANDSATAIPRLMTMGVEPFLLASTLNLVVSQRLIRKLCPHCRVSYTTTNVQIKKEHGIIVAKQFKSKKQTLYKSKGCASCDHTGFIGRVGIYEFLVVDDNIRNLVVQKATSQEIWQAASKNGAEDLFLDGLAKVKNGVTSLAELLRVAEPKNY